MELKQLESLARRAGVAVEPAGSDDDGTPVYRLVGWRGQRLQPDEPMREQEVLEELRAYLRLV